MSLNFSLRRTGLPLLLLLISRTTASVTCTADNAGGDWNNVATWTNCTGGNGNTANTPGSADTAIIATTATGTGVTVTAAETVANLTLSHATATATAVSLTGGNLTVSTLLTMSGGNVVSNSFALIVSGDCTTSVTRTAGWVQGNLRLTLPAGAATCSYPLGTDSSYTPLGLTVTAASAGGTLTGAVASGDQTQVAKGLAGINPSKSVNLYWTLTPVTQSNNTSHTATFNYSASETDGGSTAASFILRKKPNGTHSTAVGPWVTQSLSGTPTATATTVTGLTFGVYAIGESMTAANRAPYLHARERF